MKKIVSVALASIIGTSFVSICAGCSKSGPKIDSSKTQLYVSNYNGGQGTAWLDAENSTDDLIGRFEEAYKDVSFEEGKTGVQVLVVPTKTKGNTLISQMNGMGEEIFFQEDVPYGTAADAGKFLDITDVVNSVQAQDNVSISETRLENLAVGGKYYAIPHYEIYDGITYDVDLFEDELLYFADERDNGNDGFLITKNDVRSKGPDGDYDTWDDGLPASVDEFFKLCDHIF